MTPRDVVKREQWDSPLLGTFGKREIENIAFTIVKWLAHYCGGEWETSFTLPQQICNLITRW